MYISMIQSRVSNLQQYSLNVMKDAEFLVTMGTIILSLKWNSGRPTILKSALILLIHSSRPWRHQTCRQMQPTLQPEWSVTLFLWRLAIHAKISNHGPAHLFLAFLNRRRRRRHRTHLLEILMKKPRPMQMPQPSLQPIPSPPRALGPRDCCRRLETASGGPTGCCALQVFPCRRRHHHPESPLDRRQRGGAPCCLQQRRRRPPRATSGPAAPGAWSAAAAAGRGGT